MEERRVDLRIPNPERSKEGKRTTGILHIYIEDNVRIALNTSILTNNHDFYERDVLTVKDVRICKNAWNGAGVTILPGVTIGENAIVGAASVATKDVAPNTVVAGNPAKVIRELDGERFKEE